MAMSDFNSVFRDGTAPTREQLAPLPKGYYAPNACTPGYAPDYDLKRFLGYIAAEVGSYWAYGLLSQDDLKALQHAIVSLTRDCVKGLRKLKAEGEELELDDYHEHVGIGPQDPETDEYAEEVSFYAEWRKDAAGDGALCITYSCLNFPSDDISVWLAGEAIFAPEAEYVCADALKKLEEAWA